MNVHVKKSKHKGWMYEVIISVTWIVLLVFAFFGRLINIAIKQNNQSLDFDGQFLGEVVYFTVWVLAFNICYFTYKVVLSVRREVLPANNWLNILFVSLNFISFLVYVPTWAMGQQVAFTGWDGYYKTIVEHILMPIFAILYFTLMSRPETNIKYILRNSWQTTLFMFVYMFYITIRRVIIHSPRIGEEHISSWIGTFPYTMVDPFAIGWVGYMCAFIAITTFVYGISVFVGYIGLIVGKSWEKKLKDKKDFCYL